MNHETIYVTTDNDGNETSLSVKFDYFKGTMGTTDGKYGMKIEPDTDAYIEINEILDENGEVKEVGLEEQGLIESACWDKVHQDVEDALIDRYEY